MNNQLEHVSAPFQAVLQRLHNWIKDNSNVLLCVILGSQSTANSSRDEWSDIDLVLIVSDTTEFDINEQFQFKNKFFQFSNFSSLNSEKDSIRARFSMFTY